MDIYQLLSSKPHNPHYLSRYYKFILYCKETNVKLGLTKRSKKNPTGIYMEKHHILPKSKDLFPEYSSFKENQWNRIDLTPKQHFIAHYILWKVYGGGQSSAFLMFRKKAKNMGGYFKITSKTYENLKNDFSISQSERMSGERNHFYGKTHTPESKILCGIKNIGSTYNIGRKYSEFHCKQVSKGLLESDLIGGKNHYKYNHNVYNWFNETYGTFIGTVHELKTEFPDQILNSSPLSNVANNKSKIYKGWIIIR